MDLILGTLEQLKAFVLPEKERTESTWDAALSSIGLGVAQGFERYCNRRFRRVENASCVASADRAALVVDRYPIESLSALDIRYASSAGWDNIMDTVSNVDLDSGMIYLSGAPGWRGSMIRATFTGGYWLDVTADGTGVMPATATPLPDDLRYAWLLQCSHVWSLRDNAGAAMLIRDAKAGQPAALDRATLVPAVVDTLYTYRRFAF
jgi:hypothetical protein